jgi:hypothetical protein
MGRTFYTEILAYVLYFMSALNSSTMTNTYLDLTPPPAFNSVTYTSGTRVLSFGHTKPGTTDTANVTVTLPLGTSSVPGLLQIRRG